jgi:serine protease inhibitor ecotin
VYKTKGEKYRAEITIDGTHHYIGQFNTKKEAGVAYDRFVIDKSNEEVTYALNYPHMSEEERRRVSQKKHGTPNATTGLIGVSKKGDKYYAQITIDGTKHYIGVFKTKEEAGIAYDEFVVDKSTEDLTYVLNYPNMTDEQQHPYHVGQKVEVYYYEKGVPRKWFEATINAYHDDGIQIHWTVHDSLYKINNGEVESWIRLVGEEKEVHEKEYKEEQMPTYAKTVYQVDQEVEVYYPEQGVTQRWFKATIDAHLKGGIRINWNRHDTLYTVPNKRVASWIRHVGEDKELQESTSSCSSSSSSYTFSSSRAKRYTTNTRAKSSSAIVAPQSPNGEHGQLGVASSKDQSSVSKKRKVDALESEERKEQHKKQRAHSDEVVKEIDSTHSSSSSFTTAGLDAVLGMSTAPSFTAATLGNQPAEVSMLAPSASSSIVDTAVESV